MIHMTRSHSARGQSTFGHQTLKPNSNLTLDVQRKVAIDQSQAPCSKTLRPKRSAWAFHTVKVGGLEKLPHYRKMKLPSYGQRDLQPEAPVSGGGVHFISCQAATKQ